MVVRIAALGIILLLTSACSRLPNMTTAYSSLPPVAAAREVHPEVFSPTAALHLETDLPPVTMPGTAVSPHADIHGRGVNPTDVLEASERARLAWQVLRPAELTTPALYAGRSLTGLSATETGSIGASKPSVPAEAPSYDREAVMDRLEKDGRIAAKPICSACN